MPTDVVMPQMGESIAEGTIVRWIKKVGDQVDRDEPLFEISTDKVDAEIPRRRPASLTEIRAQGRRDRPGQQRRRGDRRRPARRARQRPPARGSVRPKPDPTKSAEAVAPAPMRRRRQPAGLKSGPCRRLARRRRHRLPARPPARPSAASCAEHPPAASESDIRQRSSPLVRKIAKEHNVDISQIPGTGIAGRVTKDDILGFLAGGQAAGRTRASADGRRRRPAPSHAPRRPVKPGGVGSRRARCR